MTDENKKRADFLRDWYFRDLPIQPSDDWILENCDGSLGNVGFYVEAFRLAVLDALPDFKKALRVLSRLIDKTGG